VFRRLSLRNTLLLVASSGILCSLALAGDTKAYTPTTCAAITDEFFVNEVWQKVAAQSCLKCHKAGGAADEENSEFLLKDPERALGPEREDILRFNRLAFVAVARSMKGDQSRLLLKAVGKLNHGGEEAIKADSPAYQILGDFVKRIHAPLPEAVLAQAAANDRNLPPYFNGIVMMDDRKLLRRVTLSLAGRLPTEAELSAISQQGRKALPGLLDAVMRE
jgi:hypothetical protein